MIRQHGSKYGKRIAYLACALLAATPLFGRYSYHAFIATAVVMTIAAIVGYRERERAEGGHDNR